jgi:hypothetical protein
MQTPEPSDVRRWKNFLHDFENTADPTWGFFIYGTYKRTQENEAPNTSEENETKEDDTKLAAIVDKLRAHAADYIRHSGQVVFEDKILDAMRLEPAAYLPGASFAEVVTHFCETTPAGRRTRSLAQNTVGVSSLTTIHCKASRAALILSALRQQRTWMT